MKIKLHAKAEQDLQEALDYYFEIDSKLEKKFISHLEQIFNKILKFPNLYPFETKTAQKTLMSTFPYIVIYEQYEDIIMILAIFHTSRNPIK
ncbi:MAG: type II toxin-antitoxin system RelE/ParE family toxin [Sulfurimonas sp.]|nr:type II toxin-antitoxin system RelE/ParE family toxin [Sulfurimonas sp.]